MPTRSPTIWLGTDVRVMCRDGQYVTTHPALDDATISRCRVQGARLVVVARAVDTADVDAATLSAMDDIVLLQEGVGHPVVRLVRLLRQIRRIPVRRSDVVISRIPEVVGTGLWARARLARSATIANHVAEGRAAAQFLGRKTDRLDPGFERLARLIARRSTATVYVTRGLLQAKYPPGTDLTLAISNVRLPEGWSAAGPRTFADNELHRLVAIGTLDSNVKGFDLLIRAVGEAAQSIDGLSLTIVGEGRTRPDLVELASSLGVSELVTFVGFVADKAGLAAILDSSDMIVMPSRSEGLPRAAVEAQARGLPCLASDVGGLPEAVPLGGIHAGEDVEALSELIISAHRDGDFATQLATEGYALAVDIARAADPERFTRLVRAALPDGL